MSDVWYILSTDGRYVRVNDHTYRSVRIGEEHTVETGIVAAYHDMHCTVPADVYDNDDLFTEWPIRKYHILAVRPDDEFLDKYAELHLHIPLPLTSFTVLYEVTPEHVLEEYPLYVSESSKELRNKHYTKIVDLHINFGIGLDDYAFADSMQIRTRVLQSGFMTPVFAYMDDWRLNCALLREDYCIHRIANTLASAPSKYMAEMGIYVEHQLDKTAVACGVLSKGIGIKRFLKNAMPAAHLGLIGMGWGLEEALATDHRVVLEELGDQGYYLPKLLCCDNPAVVQFLREKLVHYEDILPEVD